MLSKKTQKRIMRHKRVRAKIIGTADCPRLSVFRSNKYITLQLINDDNGQSLLQMNDKIQVKKKGTKTERAFKLGKEFAKAAKEKGVEKVVFDRGGYKYIGRVKAAADALREGGLKF